VKDVEVSGVYSQTLWQFRDGSCVLRNYTIYNPDHSEYGKGRLDEDAFGKELSGLNLWRACEPGTVPFLLMEASEREARKRKLMH
jgi:hypothetical protein